MHNLTYLLYRSGKIILIAWLLAWLPEFLPAQIFSQAQIDSMLQRLPTMKDDTSKCLLLENITSQYSNKDDPRAVTYGLQDVDLAKKLGWKTGIINAKLATATAYNNIGKINDAVNAHQDAYHLALQLGNKGLEERALIAIGGDYNYYKNDYAAALSCFVKANKLAVELKDTGSQSQINSYIGRIYYRIGDGNKALPYHFKMLSDYKIAKNEFLISVSYEFIGEDYFIMKDYDRAIFYLSLALKGYYKQKLLGFVPDVLSELADAYMLKKDYLRAYSYIDSGLQVTAHNLIRKSQIKTKVAEFYLNAADSVLTEVGVKPANRYTIALEELVSSMKMDTSDAEDLREKYHYLYQVYQHLHNYKSAYFANLRYITLKDSLAAGNAEAVKFTEKMNGYDEAKKEEAARYQQNLARAGFEQQKRYYLIGLIALAVISFFIIFNYISQRRANRRVTAANRRLNEQQEEITVQRDQLSESLSQLQSTQAQLIQSEKMASLGELTAGIAHEIQNPLNFVNNFSEVNQEMLIELNEEIDKGNYHEVKAIAKDVIDNEEKINHHGKRADAIVKGMLQHSRQTSGTKEPTDINALCDEYLRLSYHGLRAKDKNFNADFTTDFDESIGKINIVPQDIGRVLLNLFNNAFYAVNSKQKTVAENYKPLVSIQTKRINDKVEIKVSDNGNGIPQNMIDKIFQPFFTTKPTGQGTGLGLSLSYDIITKEHGGTIKVESKEGEGSQFTIILPVN